MNKKTKIAILQTKVSNNEKLNIKNSINKITLAAKKKAKIICLPELFLSTYFCQTENHSKFKLAEKIPGKKTILYLCGMRDLKYLFAYTVPVSTLISFSSFGLGTYTAVFYAFVVLPVLDVVLGSDDTNLSEKGVETKKDNAA